MTDMEEISLEHSVGTVEQLNLFSLKAVAQFVRTAAKLK